MKDHLLFAVGLILGSTLAGSYISKLETPYILLATTSKLTGATTETVSMQEFSSKQKCLFALGFLQGYTAAVSGECVEK